MANLQLSLKKQWFDLTKSGIKTEDWSESWFAILTCYKTGLYRRSHP